MCLMGHRPRYSRNQTKIFIFDNSTNFAHENNDNDNNKKLIVMTTRERGAPGGGSHDDNYGGHLYIEIPIE